MRIRTLFLFVVLAVLAVGGAMAWFYVRAQAPYRGYSDAENFVDIPSGASTRTIGTRLVQAGIVRDLPTYRFALWMSGQARRLKAGEYRFDQPMSPLEVVRKIARGEVYVINVTFPEGLTIAGMAAIFESHGFGAAASFVEAAKDASLIRRLDPSARDLEGYLFPETYPLARHTDAKQLVRLMVARFEQMLTPEFQHAAAARGLSVHATVTLASIVEKETAGPDERALVAAVYENRLRIKMALQCDPTVIYALQRQGKYTGNLGRGDLAFDSPYNTYRYAGLPPGPIAAPGRASLESVVHPADVEHLYFVSRNDGTHVFAGTLDEHNRNVQKYQAPRLRKQQSGRSGRSGGSGSSGAPASHEKGQRR